MEGGPSCGRTRGEVCAQCFATCSRLFRIFVTIFIKIASQEFVVNTRDGELVEKNLFRDFAAKKFMGYLGQFTKLTRNELNMYALMEGKLKSWERIFCCQNLLGMRLSSYTHFILLVHRCYKSS